MTSLSTAARQQPHSAQSENTAVHQQRPGAAKNRLKKKKGRRMNIEGAWS